MTTIIRSNGSKWAGQEPDTINDLLSLLSRETLDPTFEKYGGFIQVLYDRGASETNFFGNFANVSHVFDILTDDEDIIQALRSAIRANQATAAYAVERKARGIGSDA